MCQAQPLFIVREDSVPSNGRPEGQVFACVIYGVVIAFVALISLTWIFVNMARVQRWEDIATHVPDL